jgi:Amt family ammonium transporter
MTKKIVFVFLLMSCLAGAGTLRAQTPAPEAQPTAAPAAPSTAPITEADLKAAVKPTDRANGDPDGSLTGTVNDIAISDPKVGLTLTDVLNQIGADRIGVNFAWTLLCGFLIMFMQAGFAVVEAGLCRAKNANHTMMMNFMVYGVGMLAYFLIGFPLQMGGAGAIANLGGTPVLNSEVVVHLFGKDIGLFGNTGYLLMHHGTYDVAVMVADKDEAVTVTE